MTLGAYSPSPNVMDGVPLWIENLQSYLLPVIRTDYKVRNVIKRWLELNGQAIVEMLRQDFNRKVPSRGLIPYIHATVKPDEFSDESTYYGASHTIGFQWGYVVPARLMNSQNLKNPPEFVSRYLAAAVVGIILHETLHAMQLYHMSIGYRGREEYAWEERKEQGRQSHFSYPIIPIEIPTFSVNAALELATFVPEPIYRTEDMRQIAQWAIQFQKATGYSLANKVMLSEFMPTEDRDQTRLEFYWTEYGDDSVPRPTYAEFLSQLEPLEKLAAKNIKRYVRAFKTVNEYFAARNVDAVRFS
jgi:hypothetical protein